MLQVFFTVCQTTERTILTKHNKSIESHHMAAIGHASPPLAIALEPTRSSTRMKIWCKKSQSCSFQMISPYPFQPLITLPHRRRHSSASHFEMWIHEFSRELRRTHHQRRRGGNCKFRKWPSPQKIDFNLFHSCC